MEFLSILIVLGLVQFWGSGGPLQRDDWFYRWTGFAIGTVGPGRLRLVLAVAVPVVAVLFLHALFHGVLFGLLSLLLYVGVLLFSLGRGDFSEAIHHYQVAWDKGDFESAYERALAIGDFRQSDTINDPASLHEHVRSAVLYEGYQRWFGVVFWFLLLGPCGALGYRLSYICARNERLEAGDRQLACRFVHYLDWIPARLLALSFALTGNFVSGFNRFWQKMIDNMPIPELLDICARAATSGDSGSGRSPDGERFQAAASEELTALNSLLSRSVVAWLVILAVWAVADV